MTEPASPKAAQSADTLVKIGFEADLFHSSDGTGFADVIINGHRETWPVRSKGFRRWLGKRYFEMTRSAPSGASVGAALNVIEARAQFEGPTRTVHIRIAGTSDRIYLDLADEAWRCVEVDVNGWRVCAAPPVRFRRSASMLPILPPAEGGSVDRLRAFVNLRTESDFVLVIAWLLAALQNRGPYPVLVLSGEQGSAKSTLAGMLRSLVDPNIAPLRALPRDDRDLFIAANNGHVLAFDNVSGLPYWLSDTLCRLATGGGFATRQLYTDADEILIDAVRPILINGIEDMINRPDLADRSILLSLESIGDKRRRTERELWQSFREEQPRILGALLSAVARGLKALPSTQIARLPRMADFAQWIAACEPALWDAGRFSHAYRRNREQAVDQLTEADPVANSLRSLVAAQGSWQGTASELLEVLRMGAGTRPMTGASWPESPRALSGHIRRAATFLREIGVDVTFARSGRSRIRTITVKASSVGS